MPSSGTSQVEAEEPECPICLAYLYAREPRTSTTLAGNKVDLEAGNGISKVTTTTTDIAPQESKRQSMQPIDDEVLKLKRCTHMFHARCLATWFLRRKYACPVCRTPYFQMVPESDEEHQYRTQPPLPTVGFW
ncbi:hypothetical protein M426DRAFT_14176 [Hypoxylon sp. CI-4A]|nr:hypothetical protein M426DRAFT_14176 [Hypoxylon sp. CI-4A]